MTESALESGKAYPVYLDFRGISIANLTVNGTVIQEDKGVFTNHQINLAKSVLNAGQNVVTLSLLNKYRIDGVGLHSFTDGVDKLQYLYTQFEADFCHYVFPVFDQPDLKATWKFAA